jgi:hypothetical protein
VGARADVPGQAPFNQPVACTPRAEITPEAARDVPLTFIEQHAFAVLTPEQQARLTRAGVLAGMGPCRLPASITSLEPLGDEGYAVVRRLLSRAAFDALSPVHQRALVKMMEDRATGIPVPQVCFAPGSDPALVDAFNRASNGPFNERFQQGNRWSTTATNTSPTTQGDRVTLTYSFVPDGTIVPTLTSATAPSNLFAFLNGIYGTPAVWQALYQQVLDRWSQLIGVSYILEPADDGVAINPSVAGGQGLRGVRGDLRFAGTPLDGNSGVLAFNYFPGSGVGGDMVVDTADGTYSSTSNNSRFLRNVLSHEHGHGLGMAHVCPVNQTKLMEPFATNAFDGPQFDDIINGQRHYGDPIEPNDSIGSAFAVAPPPDTFVRQVPQLLSIDGTSDVDVFRFEVSSPGVLTVTAGPAGTTYLDGPQLSGGACSAGTSFDALRVNALSVAGLSATGATLAQSVPTLPGVGATALIVCPTPGTYFARVTGGPVNNIQAYRLSYSFSQTASLVVSAPQGLPGVVSPVAGTPFSVQIQAVNTTLTPGSARLLYRFDAGAFQSVPLQGPDATTGLFTATIPPAPCGASVQFYVTASAGALTSSFPSEAPAATARAIVGEPDAAPAFADDFETDRGWTLGVPGDTATAGQWVRAVPVGTAAQPGAAFSPSQCAVTGNATPGAALGTNDVDNGFTTLLSPRIDLSGAVRARVEYARWFSNNTGQNPNAKLFTIDISGDDGQTWTRGETVGPQGTSAAWVSSGFDVPASVPLTSSMRLRFVADDTGTGSLVEAAVDDVRVTVFRCVPPVSVCPADASGDGSLTVDDIFVFLNRWFANDVLADFSQSGGVTLDDIFVFLEAWFAGC